MRRIGFSTLILFVIISGWGCEQSPSEPAPAFSNESGVEILWGMGNEIPAARESALVREAPVKMITSWFSKPEDLEWLRYFSEQEVFSEVYSNGYAHELVIWLDDYPDYATSPEFQTDLQELIEIFKGKGPDYGPLYVVLFTEYETYSDDPAYYQDLRDAFMESKETVDQLYDSAYVSIGFGGYEWSGIPEREFEDWEIEVLKAGDYAAVQAHHNIENMDRMVPQIRNSVEQLGSYGKPVMLSHFLVWEQESNSGPSPSESFYNFMQQMFTEESLADLQQDGLFAWSFFNEQYITREGPALEAAKEAVEAYGTDDTDLSHFK